MKRVVQILTGPMMKPENLTRVQDGGDFFKPDPSELSCWRSLSLQPIYWSHLKFRLQGQQWGARVERIQPRPVADGHL
jgi:hypothetical protein